MPANFLEMKIDKVDQIFDEFKNAKILVIGDVMIDCYLTGKVSRISPEAPVPIVNVQSRSYRLGGAANVALNHLTSVRPPLRLQLR